MATLVGRVGLVVKGAWNSGSTYDTLDTITYNNSIYIAKQSTPAGTLPTNTTYWQLAMDSSSLQPKTMSSPVTIGGESKTTVEAAVGALEDVKADKTAISSVETTNTAVSAHAVGSYFINASGQFVKTTSAIAIGDTIIVKPTVGYNCETTNVSEVLNQLNAKVDVTTFALTPTDNVVLNAQGFLIDGIVYICGYWTSDNGKVGQASIFTSDMSMTTQKYGSGTIVSNNTVLEGKYYITTDGRLRQGNTSGTVNGGSFTFVFKYN